eukprot:1969628-Rhodomonas_salina.1
MAVQCVCVCVWMGGTDGARVGMQQTSSKRPPPGHAALVLPPTLSPYAPPTQSPAYHAKMSPCSCYAAKSNAGKHNLSTVLYQECVFLSLILGCAKPPVLTWCCVISGKFSTAPPRKTVEEKKTAVPTGE